MKIRCYQPGDETSQVAIYNAAAGALPKFKPASVQEVQRRVRARDFEPGQRFYAEENGQVVAYCNFTPHGRISFPWFLSGHEQVAQPLFEATLAAMKAHGHKRAFAAYRGDWPAVLEFFRRHGFRHVRDMVNYVVDFLDLPTPSARTNPSITPVKPEEAEKLFALNPAALRINDVQPFREHYFKNPYFQPESLFALRSRETGAPLALGILIDEPTYANPKAVDSAMPCFRLGAFGTETLTTKRIRGLFSFLARPDSSLPGLAMDLLNYAARRFGEADDLDCLAAQAASDVPALQGFYERHFRRQGSFPVFELELN